jgi:acyl phosphate:glycerol-3-phosphate acyltransferase
MVELAVVALFAYLVGSIPTGYLLARLKRVDVRAAGSGNIGATNVARTVGKGLGVLTLLIDAAKGALPVLAAAAIAPEIHAGAWFRVALPCAAALGAVIGHVFSVWLRFHGGKGVATALGAIAALDPPTLLVALLVFAIVFVVSRRVSLGSIFGSLSAPIAALVLGSPRIVVATLALIAGIIVLRHRDNIRRLQSGSEPRFRA